MPGRAGHMHTPVRQPDTAAPQPSRQHEYQCSIGGCGERPGGSATRTGRDGLIVPGKEHGHYLRGVRARTRDSGECACRSVHRHACHQRTQFGYVQSSLRRPRDIVARQIDLICAPQLPWPQHHRDHGLDASPDIPAPAPAPTQPDWAGPSWTRSRPGTALTRKTLSHGRMTDSARLASPSAEIPQVGGHSDGLEWAHCKTALSLPRASTCR
jgi:hypothetical protein